MRAIEEQGQREFYVVGVGASAGGLEALERFFDAFQPDGRFAFVVVQHLSPDFRSVMDELLARHTSLRVVRAESGMRVEPDGLYLLPARKEMTIADGRLHLRERAPDAGLSLPIDLFLSSLAEDQRERAIAVVLSGTGTDGSRGVRAVHEAGGLVLAQSEASAKFDGMPRAAVETGVVDLVLAPEEMARALASWADRGGKEEAPEEARVPPAAMTRLFDLLKRESGIDFSGYKPSTVQRRIDRRLLLSDTGDLEAYLARVEADPAELRSLYRDLLIGVTRFFRDPDAFARLRTEVIPQIVAATPDDDEARVWVPACATGEEAYSLAILFHEAFRDRGRAPAVRVFASDVHRASLEIASAGEYPADVVANVPADLRARHFVQRNGGWQVSSTLRGSVVFAQHNLLRDAPFTRLDLVSCRNFLIYLQPTAQAKVLAVLHFALRVGGCLFLGPSESPGPYAEELPALDTRWKLYRKRRDVRLSTDMGLAAPVAREPARPISRRGPDDDPRVRAARDVLLARYAPPSLLLDGEFALLHAFNGGGKFLAQHDGKPSLQVLDLLSGELKFVVGGTLKRVIKEGQPVTFGGVEVAGELHRVTVAPVRDRNGGLDGFLVSFDADRAAPDRPAPAPQADVPALAQERVAALELELRYARENLQATVEEMETSNEELQATNEELIASNEELQSTNEELHSVNEELYTVNAEYQAKIAELTELTADVNHLLEATEVHTLFVDAGLRLRKFTPRIGELFDLLPQDLGRRIDSFSHALLDDRLFADLERVAREGGRAERDVRDRHGREFFLRILPYQPGADRTGAVLTLVEISALKQAQAELARSEERYRVLVESLTALLWSTDVDGELEAPPAGWEAHTGQPAADARGRGWTEAIHPEDRAALLEAWRAAAAARAPYRGTGRLRTASGAYRTFEVRVVPLHDAAGGVREWLWNCVDVHDRARAEAALQETQERLRAILANAPTPIWVKDVAGRYVLASRTASATLGEGRPLEGKTDHDLLDPEHADRVRGVERRVVTSGEAEDLEEALGPDGRTWLVSRFPLRDGAGRITGIAGIAVDISARTRAAEEDRRAIEARDRFMAMLSHELRTPLGAILNASELLQRGDVAAERRARAQEIIQRQSRQMARLIDDLLDVSRVTRERLPLRLEPVDLRAVIREVVEASRPAIDAKGLAIGVELPDAPVRLVGDAVRLQQAFGNLLSNALRYTPSGRIDVSLALEPSRAVVRVRDTGIGMTPEQVERAFDLYYQAPQSMDRSFGGLGVGLSLAQTLLQAHGGGVRASSAGLGRGSEFVVTLPIAPEADEQERPAPERRRLRIVLVEDSEDIRDTLRELLELEGHEVLVARDGVEGAELITRSRPDLAFVDVGLPQLDGYGVARRIRGSLGRTVQLVALTGYGSSQDRAAAIEAGFDDHLVKPVEAHRLLRLVEGVMAG